MSPCRLPTLLSPVSAAAELARQRTKPVAELAKELRTSESCLRNWMAQADVDDAGGDAPQLTSQENR
jgi:transposase